MSDDPAPIAGRVRSRHYRRLAHGLHQPTAHTGDLAATLRAWHLLLPRGAAFTSISAAQLRGCRLPPLPDDAPVLAAIERGGCTSSRRELRLARYRGPLKVEVVDGVRVVSVPEMVLACARDLCLVDLVVLVDGLLHGDPSLRSDLEVVAAGRRRGAPLLREALTLADHRSESAWETMLRLLFKACGIEVTPQHVVVTAAGGHVATSDLWLVGTTTLAEYDGDCHLPAAQQRKDLRRLRRLSGVHWTRHGYTSADVLHRAVGILRDADQALGRAHDPSRIRAWHALLRDSAWTGAGRARLARRWGMGGETTDSAP